MGSASYENMGAIVEDRIFKHDSSMRAHIKRVENNEVDVFRIEGVAWSPLSRREGPLSGTTVRRTISIKGIDDIYKDVDAVDMTPKAINEMVLDTMLTRSVYSDRQNPLFWIMGHAKGDSSTMLSHICLN